MPRRFDDFEWFPPSVPLEAKGGIKAASKRGGFGESWWAKRWIAVLESFNIGTRLRRGSSYARKGQVLSVDISSGLVVAQVQGSRPRAYDVSIKVKTLPEDQWKQVAESLSTQAIYAAKLLAGEMPTDIEQVFRSSGVSLFPERSTDLSTECSCPDWSNPCKHVAAVYYLLGEAFDKDPFLIFRLRGLDRGAFVGMIEAPSEEAEAPVEPLPSDPEQFWSGKPLPADWLSDARVPKLTATLLHRLGNLQFWRGSAALIQALEPIYKSASKQAERLLAPEKALE